jgi:hypothetical protein
MDHRVPAVDSDTAVPSLRPPHRHPPSRARSPISTAGSPIRVIPLRQQRSALRADGNCRWLDGVRPIWMSLLRQRYTTKGSKGQGGRLGRKHVSPSSPRRSAAYLVDSCSGRQWMEKASRGVAPHADLGHAKYPFPPVPRELGGSKVPALQTIGTLLVCLSTNCLARNAPTPVNPQDSTPADPASGSSGILALAML